MFTKRSVVGILLASLFVTSTILIGTFKWVENGIVTHVHVVEQPTKTAMYYQIEKQMNYGANTCYSHDTWESWTSKNVAENSAKHMATTIVGTTKSIFVSRQTPYLCVGITTMILSFAGTIFMSVMVIGTLYMMITVICL